MKEIQVKIDLSVFVAGLRILGCEMSKENEDV